MTGLYVVYWKWRFGPAPKWEVYDRPSGFITADPVAQYFSEEEMDFRLATEGLARGEGYPRRWACRHGAGGAEAMKVRLLRRWNRLMDGVYAFDAVWNMTVPQRLFYAWLRLTGLIRLGHAAVAEFNEYYAGYHHLGYTVGPRALVWRLHRRGKEMHSGRENAWSWFSRKYRRYSKKWNSPDAVLGVRAAAAQTKWFRSKEEALVVCAAEGVELWEAGIDSVRYRGRECENRDLVG